MSRRTHHAQERWSVWWLCRCYSPRQQEADECPDCHEDLHLKLPLLAFGQGSSDAGRLAIKAPGSRRGAKRINIRPEAIDRPFDNRMSAMGLGCSLIPGVGSSSP